MALIIRSSVIRLIGITPENASAFYITIPEDFLSSPYELASGDEIAGKIVSLYQRGKEIPSFREKAITFILQRSIVYDNLFISKKDWQTHFRDWGLVLPDYQLTVALDKAIRKPDTKWTELYPQQDFRYGS